MLAFALSAPQRLRGEPGESVCVPRRSERALRARPLRARCARMSTGLDAYAAGVSVLEGEGAYAVMAAAEALEASSGERVVRLMIGEPSFATPAHVADAAIAAISAGRTKYSSPAGVAELRAAIAQRVSAQRGVRVAAAEVVVGPGAKPGLFLATLAVVRGPADQVVLPDPGFPTYRAMVAVAGGTPVPVPLRPDMASFDMHALRAAVGPSTRLVVLNSPGNPTGGVIPREDLEEIARLAELHDFWVISDEIYSQLYYDSTAEYSSIISFPRMKRRTILVDGFSKSYCMTGWRLGWAVMPEHLARRLELLMTHSVGCTATFTQAAGLAALRGPDTDVEQLRRVYKQRRDIVVDALNAIPGVQCCTPAGAFYAFPDVSAFGLTSREIADRLLYEGFVAVLPGTDFGDGGEGHIRLSYVSEESELREGIARIAKVLGKIRAEMKVPT